MYTSNDTEDPMILSITILDEGVQITFTEERDQSPHVEMAKTIVIEASKIDNAPQDIEDILDASRSLVENALLELRNPPKQFTRRRRREEAAPVTEGDA